MDGNERTSRGRRCNAVLWKGNGGMSPDGRQQSKSIVGRGGQRRKAFVVKALKVASMPLRYREGNQGTFVDEILDLII